MKTLKNGLIIFFILLLFPQCDKKAPEQELYSKEFNWKITIPENFESVSPEEWRKLQNKGEEAIEKTYGDSLINQSKTIFVFKNSQLNYMEANYQPFDTLVDGNYLQSCREVNAMLYETFVRQMPDISADTLTSTETIDGLLFQTFKIKMVYPNKLVMNLHMYSRLFDKREFTVNIMYAEDEMGEKMLKAWRSSKFDKLKTVKRD